MQYAFCFISAEDAKDGTKLGYAYAKSKQSEWVVTNDECESLVTQCPKGVGFIVHNNKAYFLHKRYLDVDSSKTIVLCIESTCGSDNKLFN
jgi:hypothetical protein